MCAHEGERERESLCVCVCVSEKGVILVFQLYAPRHKKYVHEIIIEEHIFARIHMALVFALARIEETSSEELFMKYVFAPLPPPSVWIWWLYSHTPCANTQQYF